MSEEISGKPNSGPATLWPAIMTLGLFGVLIFLGIWQMQRLEWKTQLLERIKERQAAAAVELPTDLAIPGQLEFRRVALEGRFQPSREAHLFTTNNFGVPGYHIYAPFRLKDGRVLIVNRGWVPENLRLPETRPESRLDGPLRLSGVVRLSREPGWFTPDNDPGANIWYYADLEAMAAYLGVKGALPLFVELDRGSAPGDWPRGGVSRLNIPNNHLVYAITWFSLAVILLVIFGLWLRKARNRGAARR